MFGNLMEDIEKRINKIVFTNGCFDILHRGHVEYLQKSKALGDLLVVGINSDASIKRLKGNSRPINNQQDREFMLKSLECVDEVLVFNEDTPLNIIESLRPNIITKGGDYTVEEVVGHDIVPETYIISLTNGYSTTNFIERIRNDSA
jgi:rfaE bifunctional protein nucleotidyltransferase chain/domain